MSTSESSAQRTLGAVVHADFAREAADFAAGGRVPDWLAWSHRLATSLGGLLRALDAADQAREVLGRAAITPSGMVPVTGLLDVLAEWIDDTIASGQPPKWVAYTAATAVRMISDLTARENGEGI